MFADLRLAPSSVLGSSISAIRVRRSQPLIALHRLGPDCATLDCNATISRNRAQNTAPRAYSEPASYHTRPLTIRLRRHSRPFVIPVRSFHVDQMLKNLPPGADLRGCLVAYPGCGQRSAAAHYGRDTRHRATRRAHGQTARRRTQVASVIRTL
ncbi:hypothetical protein BC834DRAFT_103980 [Gloeopeniophorella convolvens]|nr:hypothetical protein BC834DRAFT_103980 [Gloeopeniophorella convolvens]